MRKFRGFQLQWLLQRFLFTSALTTIAICLVVSGCGPAPQFSRTTGRDAGPIGTGGSTSVNDDAADSNGATGGGMVVGTGGGIGSGGMGSGGDTGQTGGTQGSGGSVGNTGGAGTGGSASGGATPTGGNASGGSGTGGSASGGSNTGGSAGIGGGAGGAGGVGTGGKGTGGASTGGASTGGTSGPLYLSIDFVGGITGGGPTGTVAMAATESAGVKSAARWNSAAGATGTLSALVLANGTATTAAATWSAAGTWSLGLTDASGNVRMMNGYLDPVASTAPATVTVSALPTSITAGGYDVYVYCYTDANSGETRTGDYKIGSTTFTVVQTGPSATTFAGFVLAPNQGPGNYVVFRNVTGSSFTLTATPSGGTVPRAPVNGIQIVWPAGT